MRIVEERNYTFRPGTLGRFLELYEAEGLEIHRGHLGELVGYFTSETGELNQAVHLWAFEGWDDRARRRASLNADPAWHAFSAKVSDMVLRMETRLLTPARFSPIR